MSAERAAEVNTYEVRAVRWAKGWELYVGDDCLTQCKTLDQAEHMVRECLEVTYDRPFDDAVINVTADLGGLEREALAARQAVEAATAAQTSAAARYRKVVAALRANGLPVAAIAEVMGISKARVSQLTR